MKDLITNIAEIFTRRVGKKNQNDQEMENQKAAKALFVELNNEEYDKYPFEKMNLDEGMILIKEVIGSYWKPRYLINTHNNVAYEIMNLSETFLFVTDNDIDWDSLKGLGEDCLERAKCHSFHFPSFINQFKNGVAQVQWQLNPDGRYYEDEDGYGMTDDEEVNIYGFIDTKGKVIVPFQYVSGQEMIDELRAKAEKIVKSDHKVAGAPADTKSKRIFNLIILDESGSMSCIKQQAINGFNETIQTIKAAKQSHPEQEHLVTFVSFDSTAIKTVYERVPVNDVPELDGNTYHPNACTPLYDAMGKSLNALRSHVNKDDVVLVTVITDGEENSSHEYTGKAIKALVDELRAANWVFTYIGANQDVEKVAATISITNVMNFETTHAGTDKMFATERKARTRFFDRIANGESCCDMQEDYFEDK